MNRNQELRRLLRQPVVPVLTIDEPDLAVPLARALSDGGLPVLEVTMRTDHALRAIKAIAEELAGRAIVGAGTVLHASMAAQAMAAGASFIVSPGVTPSLIQAAETWRVPFMPGVATPSEAMALADLGYDVQKFFPAEQLGGSATLKAWAAPLPGVSFCPTGGINAASASKYLALATVICVGGSWVAPTDLVARRDWQAIKELAMAASALSGSSP